MHKRLVFFFAIIVLAVPFLAAGDQPQGTAVSGKATTVKLPPPSRSGGMALTEALARRRSVREFKATALTPAEISQLLWAAQGITDDKGHRTAPSAHAAYFLHVYVATPEGFSEYLPAGHELQKLSPKDLRAAFSSQKAVTAAPAVLLVTGDYDRAVQKFGQEIGQRLVNLEAGHAAQNVLLQATALGLAAVPVGGIAPKQIQEAASLPAGSTPIYLIPVGH